MSVIKATKPKEIERKYGFFPAIVDHRSCCSHESELINYAVAIAVTLSPFVFPEVTVNSRSFPCAPALLPRPRWKLKPRASFWSLTPQHPFSSLACAPFAFLLLDFSWWFCRTLSTLPSLEFCILITNVHPAGFCLEMLVLCQAYHLIHQPPVSLHAPHPPVLYTTCCSTLCHSLLLSCKKNIQYHQGNLAVAKITLPGAHEASACRRVFTAGMASEVCRTDSCDLWEMLPHMFQWCVYSQTTPLFSKGVDRKINQGCRDESIKELNTCLSSSADVQVTCLRFCWQVTK